VTSVLSGGLAGAFLRYRIMAYTTGVLLVLLVFVAMPIRYWGHNHGPVAVIGTAHGFLFMVYLLTAFDLGVRLRWPWLKLGLVMVAGTVPFASFYAEHRAHADLLARSQAARAQVAEPGPLPSA
jgi:integral membrane protein